MENRRLAINAIAALIQTIVIGVVYFFLYRFVLRLLGADRLGLWSLVIASTSIGNIANLGMTGSIVKFVSAAQANKNGEKSADIIYTTILTVGVFMVLICFLLFGVFYFNLKWVVPLKFLAEARMILPYALLSLLLNSMSAIFLSALDGLELIYIRAFIYASSSIFFLILCHFYVPNHGLMGLVYAQLIQSGFVLVAGIALLYIKLKEFSLWRIRFKLDVFKEIFSYGVSFQIISITGLLFDPITKFCLSSFSGLSTVGYFEMANRLISQVRSLVASTNEAVVPFIARKNEVGHKDMSSYYSRMFKIMTLNSVFIFSGLAIFSPVISVLWIGSMVNMFVGSVLFLSIGWVFNIISAPAYFINMGTGQLKWNVISHIVLSGANMVLGFLLGKIFGGFYVILGTCLSLIFSSIILIVKFNKLNGIDARDLSDRYEVIFIVCLVLLVLSTFAFYVFDRNIKIELLPFYSVVSLILLGILGWGLWKVKSLSSIYMAIPKMLFKF